MKGYRYQRLATLLVMALLLLGLVACKKDKADDGDDVSGVQVAPAIIGTNTPQPPQVVTVVVTRTPIPQITPSLTPTLDFPAYKVAGTWSLYVRFDINDEGLVKQLGYSANATLNVTDYGVVTGNGMLMPTPSDPVCEIHPLGGEGFSFDIQGILRPDGERILMDIELIPTSYSATENYEVRCPEDAPDFRTVSQPNLIWPILSQTQRTKFTFDLTQPSYTVTFSEDIAARTDNVIEGMLVGELITLQ